MNDLVVTYGSGAEGLARKVAQISGARLAEVDRRIFPDGEQYVRVCGDVCGKDVAILQSFALSPDRLLVEYALIADAVSGMGCRRVIGAFPYIAYARQDERFSEGEALSAKVFATLIEASGTDAVYTVDMHLHRFRDISEIFRIPATNLSAMRLLAEEYSRHLPPGRILVVGPDRESSQWVKAVADVIPSSCAVLEKERLGDREVRISEISDSMCSTALIVDDMISTGKTILEVLGKLKASGVERVDALVTHVILVEGAYSRLKEAGLNSLITTDTIANEYASVSIAPLLADALMLDAAGKPCPPTFL
ncbi:MAG: ribose-phosphate diphosphokinase [Candidatus Methanosuratus sp.]|nr:ribose-phosphate diphosphokinase [Candidatus Methanosuratincola sp.]